MPALPPASAALSLDRRLGMLLMALSVVFSLVPFTLSMGATGPEATHTLAGGSSLRQVQYGSIYLAAVWLVWRHRDWTARHLRQMNPFLLIVVAYCFASMLWSAAPMVSLKRGILLVGLLLIGLAAAPPIGGSRQSSQVLMMTLTLLVAVSAVVALAFPAVGVDYELGGAWRGIMWQKNVLGSIAGFAAILWLREALLDTARRRRAAVGLVLCIFVLGMSKSATALVVTCVGMGLYLGLRRRRLAGRHTPWVVSMVLLATVLLVLQTVYVLTGRLPSWDDIVGPVTSLLGKSSDLTGRSEIWRLVLYSVERHPVWGIGYGAFWLGDNGPSQYIADILAWMPSHAHNGYIDVLNELGAVGLALLVAMLLWHVAQLMRLFSIDREEAAIHLSFLVLILISNFSETQLLADVAFQNIVLIYSSITISALNGLHRHGQTLRGA